MIEDLLPDGIADVTILPEQFLTVANRMAIESPHHRLVLAVLIDALRRIDLGRRSSCRKTVQAGREALWWFESTTEDRWPYSCENVCAYLGLNASVVRQYVRQIDKRGPVGRIRKPR